MIKKILISLVLIIVLVVGAVFFYLDSIVKSGIEVVGPQVLGVDVSVASVSISPLSGSGTIRGLIIGNPEGFNSDQAFQLDEVSVALNTGSVFADVVEIESVRIVQPQITYETRITEDNIRALINNVTGGGSGEPAAESAPAEGGKQLIIREFQLLDPQLNLVAAFATAPIPLPDIVLNDIGAEDDSATVAEVLEQVLGALNTSILAANLPDLDELRDQVEGRLQDGVEEVEEAVDDAVEELGGRLRSILN